MNYKKRTLEYLVNKYENSKLRANTNVVNITIKARIEKIFPKYIRPEIFHDYDLLHEELKELESSYYIELIWEKFRKDYILEEVILNIDQIDEIYQYLGKIPKTIKEKQAILLCKQFMNKNEFMDCLLTKLIVDLQEQKSVKKYIDLDNLDCFKDQLLLMQAIMNNGQEYYIRELSIQLFHNSKTAQKYISKVAGMIKECYEDLESYSNDEILEEFNIYKNPSWIKIKGINCLSNPFINTSTFNNGISFSSKDIPLLSFDQAKKIKNIITIENETSFERIDGNDEDTLYLYLAGFHNSSKRNFLIRLYQAYPDCHYYHFGDIDCGGFRIYKHLCLKTNIPFRLLKMDLSTLKDYQAYAKDLEGDDIHHLQKMMEDPFFSKQQELFMYMLEKGIKLEQECIQLNKDHFL